MPPAPDLNLNQVRERIEAREALLSPLASRSSEAQRARPEPPSEVRGAFQRDRDRSVHSQVLIAPRGDHYTTRLTHVMEVAQVGVTIARALNLNEDLVMAAGLGHDLGHTPFGHVGEEVLNQLLADSGGFHHSRHSVRIVELLENDGAGMNLTRDVVEAIRRHSKPRGGFMDPANVEGLALEAQIVRLSDALAYLMHDINDALRCNVLAPEDLPAAVRDALGERHSQRVNSAILDVVRNSWDCTGAPTGETPRIRMSPAMERTIIQLREFMFERFYLPVSSRPSAVAAREVVLTIWDHLHSHPGEIPERTQAVAGGLEQAVADHLCGMTDLYAIRVAEAVRPGVADPIRAEWY